MRLLALLVLFGRADSTGPLMPSTRDGGTEGCGDGIIGSSEVCDPGAPLPLGCDAFGFPGGSLACNRRCAGYLVGSCEGMPTWAEGFGNDGRSCPAGTWREGERCVGCSDDPLGPALALDLDVETTTVTGQITIGGAVPPEGGAQGRGRVTFAHVTSAFDRRAALNVVTASISATGVATYRAALLPGIYRVLVSLAAEGLPEASVVVAESFTAPDAQVLDLDLPEPAQISVSVDTPDGVPESRSLGFRDVRTGDVESIPIGEDGTGRGLVYPGRYIPTSGARTPTSCDYRWPEVEIDGETALSLTLDAHPVRIHVRDDGEPAASPYWLQLFGPCGSQPIRDSAAELQLVRYAGTYRPVVMEGTRAEVEFEVPGTEEITVDAMNRLLVKLTGRVSGGEVKHATLRNHEGREIASALVESRRFEMEAPAAEYQLEVGPLPGSRRVGRPHRRPEDRPRAAGRAHGLGADNRAGGVAPLWCVLAPRVRRIRLSSRVA